jgi:hypothetical protein
VRHIWPSNVILLIGGSRQAVDATWKREALVFGCKRRARYLRDHESRIDSAILDEEARQTAQIRIEKQCQTAFRNRADLGNRCSYCVGGEGHCLRVEIPAGQYISTIRKDQWLCTTTIAENLYTKKQ